MSKYAYITVITNDAYEVGVLALWNSVYKAGCKEKFVVMVSEKVSKKVKERLSKLMNVVVFNEDIEFDKDITKDNKGFFEKWNSTFFKLKVLTMCEYEKIVLLDADMVVMRNLDSLFAKPHMSCAFAETLRDKRIRLNSGLIVLEPSQELYNTMVSAIIPTKELLKGKSIGDQNVFRYVYPDWPCQNELHLEPVYNCYNTDIDEFIEKNIFSFNDIYVVHYTLTKPWEIDDKVLLKQKVLSLLNVYKQKYLLKSNLIWKENYKEAIKKLKKL